jgi:hypothetical protein
MAAYARLIDGWLTIEKEGIVTNGICRPFISVGASVRLSIIRLSQRSVAAKQLHMQHPSTLRAAKRCFFC